MHYTFRTNIDVIFNYAKYLHRQNEEATVYTTKYDGRLSKQDFKVIGLKPFLKYGNGAFLPQLFFKLKNYDVVHLHYPFFGTTEIVWLAKIFFRKKFKLAIHYHMDVAEPSFFE